MSLQEVASATELKSVGIQGLLLPFLLQEPEVFASLEPAPSGVQLPGTILRAGLASPDAVFPGRYSSSPRSSVISAASSVAGKAPHLAAAAIACYLFRLSSVSS